MKRRKARYLLMTLALTIAVALFGGVMIVSDSFQGMMLNSIDKQMGTADILFHSEVNEEGWFDPDDIDHGIPCSGQAVCTRLSCPSLSAHQSNS